MAAQTPGAAFVTLHAATEYVAREEGARLPRGAQPRAPRGAGGVSKSHQNQPESRPPEDAAGRPPRSPAPRPAGRRRRPRAAPRHATPRCAAPPRAARPRPAPACDRPGPRRAALTRRAAPGPEMPLFSVPKEVAVGTAMLGVAFATGMLAGKRRPPQNAHAGVRAAPSPCPPPGPGRGPRLPGQAPRPPGCGRSSGEHPPGAPLSGAGPGRDFAERRR